MQPTFNGYFITIRGPLGVGKTTITKKLAEILNAEYISIDQILEEHGLDKVDDPNAESIPVENFIQTNTIVLPQVKEQLREGRIVIFDGNFYQKKALEHLIERLPSPQFIFTLKASLETCIERDKQREKPYGKDATEAVYNLTTRFDYGTNIDTENKTTEEVVEKIISYLPENK